jgi:hypothetical protein
MIRLLDLPLVPEIENRIRLNAMVPSRETDHDLERMIETLVRETLGCRLPSYMYSDALYGDGDYVDDDDDDDDITSWRKDGFDIRGEDGAELKCMKRIDWALEVVVAGLGERTRIEIEADLWKRSKLLDEAVNQNHKAKDRQFLALGGRGRRRA